MLLNIALCVVLHCVVWWTVAIVACAQWRVRVGQYAARQMPIGFGPPNLAIPTAGTRCATKHLASRNRTVRIPAFQEVEEEV